MTSPGLKALRYAENNLGVNQVYQDAKNARIDLDELLTEISELRDKRRSLEARRLDKEMEVAAEERGKHPEMAENRMEKHLKIAFFNDSDIRLYRDEITKLSSDIEGREYDKEILEADIKIAVARLQELGGYLNYLAAIKTAEVTREAREAEQAKRDSGDPWK